MGENNQIPSKDVADSAEDSFRYNQADSMYSWLVCAAAFFCVFISVGISNSFGIYQTFYMANILQEAKPSTIAWIGTLSTAMMLLTSVISSRVFMHIGFRFTAWVGAILGFAGLFAASFCNSVGAFIATQGIIYGIGVGFIYSTSISVVVQWFEKRRGMALGIVTSGSGVGGLVVSRIINSIIENLGFRWALRITSFMFLATALTGAMTYKFRITIDQKAKLIDFSAFKAPVFLLTLVTGFVGNLGYVVPIFFIPSVIQQLGGSASFASNQVTILNVGYLIGGFAIGVLADFIGPLNAFGISAFFSGFFSLIFWVVFKTKASLTVVSFFYGFFVPGFISQCIAAFAKHFPAEKWAPYNGTYLSFNGVSVICGNLIITSLLGSSGGEPNFDRVAKFSAICYIAGSFAVIPAVLYLRAKAGSNKTWKV